MKKTLYIMGSIEALTGFILICVTSIIKELMPVLGYIAYQEAAAGSYNAKNYQTSFSIVAVLASILVVVGIMQILLAFLRKSKHSDGKVEEAE